MRITTNLELLKRRGACHGGLKTLISHLGVGYPKDKPINLLTILESNGTNDFYWALQATEQSFLEIRKTAINLAADIAESVLPFFESAFPNDKRPGEVIAAARKAAHADAVTDPYATYLAVKGAYNAADNAERAHKTAAYYAARAAICAAETVILACTDFAKCEHALNYAVYAATEVLNVEDLEDFKDKQKEIIRLRLSN